MDGVCVCGIYVPQLLLPVFVLTLSAKFFLLTMAYLRAHPRILRIYLPIFIVALTLRLTWFLIVLIKNPSGFIFPDSFGYLSLAGNLLHHGVFSQGIKGDLYPDAVRTPGYPLFVLIVKELFFGFYGVLIVQVILSALVAVMTARLTILIFSNTTAAFMAGLSVSVNFASVMFASTLLTDTLFTFIMLLSVTYVILCMQTGKQYHVLFAGVLAGAMVLCRPVAALLPLLLGCMVAFKKIQSAILFTAISYIIVVPWVARNHIVFGSPFLSTIGEVNLLMHTAASIRSTTENKPIKIIQQEYKTLSAHQFDWTKPEANVRFADFSRKETFRVIMNHPGIFIQNYLTSFVFFFIKPVRHYIDVQLGYNKRYQSISGLINDKLHITYREVKHKTSKIALLLTFYQLIYIFGVLLFVLIALRYSSFSISGLTGILLLIIFYFAILSSITEVDARFRLPVIPYFCALAGVGIAILRQKK